MTTQDIATECFDCGVQLNADGTVDTLDGEPDQHYAGCTATFTVAGYTGGEQTEELNGPGGRPWRHYGPARDALRQRKAMSGPRIDWRIE